MTVKVFTTPYCPFCVRAKQLLRQKGVDFQEIDVSQDHEERQKLVERTRRTSVPQIFIGERHVGGCDELYALDRAGELGPLLTATVA